VELYREDDLYVVKLGPLGPWNNNAYIIGDRAAGRALLVDMPDEGEKILAALGDTRVEAIIATHWHVDHWMSYDLLRGGTGAPVLVYEAEVNVPPERIDGRLKDEQEVRVGGVRVRVIHTPGHTPGSISLLVGRVLISGDTLFKGGPGHTEAPDDLQQELTAITTRLFPLPDDILVAPGHGEGTILGEAKREYAVFAARRHRSDLYGDIVWLETA
jgi:glyoxylase-like metal-dependent hydrolase (beta-lactamase superfamily II)